MSQNLVKIFSTSFVKGLNMSASHMIDDEECQLAENFLFNGGIATVRQGTKLNATLPGPVSVIKKYYQRNGSSFFVAAVSGILYVSTVSGTFSSVSCEPFLGKACMETYDDFLYVTNYSTSVKYFDGTNMDIAGLSSPVHQKLIGDLTTVNGWNTGGAGGSLTLDTNFARFEIGESAIHLNSTPNSYIYIISQLQTDLTTVGGVASDLDDLIQITAVHGVKSKIKALTLAFYNLNSVGAVKVLTNVSAWISCSSDSSMLHYTIPKREFALTSSNFIWGSCQTYLAVEGWGSGEVTFSDLKLVKTPPILAAMSTAIQPMLYFGSSIGFSDRFYTDRQGVESQLQGMVGNIAAIPDGEVYYKATFVKGGPHGMLIESNPTQQTSSVSLSTSISTYLVDWVGTGVSTIMLMQHTEYTEDTNYPSSYNTLRELGYDPSNFTRPIKTTTYWVYPDGTKAATPTSGSYYVTAGSGGYTYAYVKVSGATISTVVMGKAVGLTNIPIAPPAYNCCARNIYRRLGTEPAYRFVTTIADNFTTTYQDLTPQGALGVVLDETKYPPPKAKYIYAAGDQRVYYLNISEGNSIHQSRVRFSKPYEPHYVPLENVFDVNPGDGTQLTGAFEYSGMFCLLKERSTWVKEPNGTVTQIHPSYGCVAPNSIAVAPEGVFWLSDDGIVEYSMRFRNITLEQNRISEYMSLLPKEYLTNAAGIYYKGLYLLAITREGATSNDAVLCYDIFNNKWSIFPDINVNCWTTWGGSTDGFRLFYGNNSGQICEFLTGDVDISSHIPWAIQTKDIGAMTPQISFRVLYTFMKDLDGGNRTIKVSPYYDMVNISADNNTINTAGNTSGLGLEKSVLPAKDDSSFFSVKLNSSGRCSIIRMDLYSKEDPVR